MLTACHCAAPIREAGDSAAQLYRKVLAEEEENVDALHLMGVLHHQRGEHARAVELIGRAVALRPNVPAFHVNLAEAYRAQGQFDRAIGCCRTALRLWPDHPEALCNLGLGLQGLGRHAEAVEQFHRALQLPGRTSLPPTANLVSACANSPTRRSSRTLPPRRRAGSRRCPRRTNLGQLLVHRGQAEEGVPHSQERRACSRPSPPCTMTSVMPSALGKSSRPGPPT